MNALKRLSFWLLLLLPLHLPAVKFVTIGTGCVDGLYYPTGEAICDISNLYKKETGIRCAVQASCGSVDNLTLLKEHEFDFAITQSDILADAYRKNKKDISHIKAVMGLYPELLTLVVRKDAGIKKLSDITGKKISIGAQGSGTEMTVKRLFSICKNLDMEKLSIVQFEPDYDPVALKQRKIDGYFFVVGHPSAGIKKLAISEALDLIPITRLSCKEFSNLFSRYNSYAQSTIPGKLYKGINHPTPTFGVKAVLVTTDEMDDATIRAMIRAMIKNFHTFKKRHPAYGNMKIHDIVKGLGAPLHPAAKAYYRQIGLLHE